MPATALPATAAARPKKVKAPKSGKYTGTTGASRTLTLYVSGKSVSIVAFQFACGQAKGNASISDIALKKTKKGYRFSVSTHGIVTYSDSDSHPDENGTIAIKGRFDRKTAKKVAGTVRVKTPRCGDTGSVYWTASR